MTYHMETHNYDLQKTKFSKRKHNQSLIYTF